MDDKTTETLPPIERNQGWKPRQQHKKTIVEKEPEEEEPELQDETPPPYPLPFGKLDIFA